MLLMIGTSACQNRPIPSFDTEKIKSLPVSYTTYRKIAEIGLIQWSEEDQNSRYAYVMDSENPKMKAKLPASLSEILAPKPNNSPEDTYVIYIDEVVIPELNFAFLTMRTTNRFEAHEYTIVFEQTEQGWQVLDYYFIAGSLIETALKHFSWEVYKAKLQYEKRTR